MRLIRGIHNLNLSGCALTIGSFDGWHLDKPFCAIYVKKADALDLPVVVMLFEPQPRE